MHVKNENFLDMNVAVVASGVSRRLGQVTGNSSARFQDRLVGGERAADRRSPRRRSAVAGRYVCSA